ncbi:MAG TPA: CDP-glucose 4,6-dehydratase, partial [Chryseosolibacter sp.]
PWQHVLEPLDGYLQLGAVILDTSRQDLGEFCGPFNFGPNVSSNKPVAELVDRIIRHWGRGSWTATPPDVVHHEASLLNLSIDKAYHKLNWLPRWDFDTTVRHTVEWYSLWNQNEANLIDFTIEQIQAYQDTESPVTAGARQNEIQSLL